MHTRDDRLTGWNLVISAILVLGLASVAGLVEPLTIPADAEPGTTGLGQLLWIIAPLAVMLLLRTLGGWAAIISLGALQSGLPVVLCTSAIRRTRALDAVMITVLEPVLNPIWVYPVVGERPVALA